jgi:hypothetical protein
MAVQLPLTDMVLRDAITIVPDCFKVLDQYLKRDVTFVCINKVWKVHVTHSLINCIVRAVHPKAKINYCDKFAALCINTNVAVEDLKGHAKFVLPKNKKMKEAINAFFSGKDWTNLEENLKAGQIAQDQRELSRLMRLPRPVVQNDFIFGIGDLMRHYPDFDLFSLRDDPVWSTQFLYAETLLRPKRQRTL